METPQVQRLQELIQENFVEPITRQLREGDATGREQAASLGNQWLSEVAGILETVGDTSTLPPEQRQRIQKAYTDVNDALSTYQHQSQEATATSNQWDKLFIVNAVAFVLTVFVPIVLSLIVVIQAVSSPIPGPTKSVGVADDEGKTPSGSNKPDGSLCKAPADCKGGLCRPGEVSTCDMSQEQRRYVCDTMPEPSSPIATWIGVIVSSLVMAIGVLYWGRSSSFQRVFLDLCFPVPLLLALPISRMESDFTTFTWVYCSVMAVCALLYTLFMYLNNQAFLKPQRKNIYAGHYQGR